MVVEDKIFEDMIAGDMIAEDMTGGKEHPVGSVVTEPQLVKATNQVATNHLASQSHLIEDRLLVQVYQNPVQEQVHQEPACKFQARYHHTNCHPW